MRDHLLSILVFAPLLGSVIVLALPPGKTGTISKVAALICSLPSLFLSIVMLKSFDPSIVDKMQFSELIRWIPDLGINYHIGVDGLSVPLILLTTVLSTVSLIASWGIVDRTRGYFSLFLLLEFSMLGVFVSLDFFLFYIFWEIMLVPMYFLIGIWGGPRREYAAIKFFIYTLIGSLLMLVGIIALYYKAGINTFDIIEIGKVISVHPEAAKGFGIIVFILIFTGFAIKVPIFPFHTWLPDAHVEAPTAISVILAGVLLKLGIYGILRVNYTILPQAAMTLAPYIAILGVINIVYGALVAMAQTDLKKLIAYSSVSHMGFCVLGISTFQIQAFNGAIMQMMNHGMVTAGLFLLVGVIYDRAHTRDINGFGGLAKTMPQYSGVLWLVFFASLGLPGLCSFWGEFFVLLGSYHARVPAGWTPQFFNIIIYICAAGIVITAAYHLWTIQRMFLGKVNEKWAGLKDLDFREIITLAPTIAYAIIIGVLPALMINIFAPYVTQLLKSFGG